MRSKLFSLIFLSTSFLSLAQTADETIYDLFNVSLEDLLDVEMVTATKNKKSVLDVPATALVISEQLISARKYAYLIDVLNDIPEIEIQFNSNPLVKNYISVRGIAGNEKLLILLNGERITPASGDLYAFANQFALSNTKQIEVVLGPASALYGVDAFSGIINIITKTYNKDGSNISADVNYGAYNTRNANLYLNRQYNQLEFSLSGNFSDSKNADYSNIYTKEYDWYTNQFKPKGLVVESPFYNQIQPIGVFQANAGPTFNGSAISREFAMPQSSYYLNAQLGAKNLQGGYVLMQNQHSTNTGVNPRYSTRAADAFIRTKQQVFYGKHTLTSFNQRMELTTNFSINLFEINPESNYISAASRWQRGYFYGYSKTSKIEEQLSYNFSAKVSGMLGTSFQTISALPRTGLAPTPYDPHSPSALQQLYYIGATGYSAEFQDENGFLFNDSLAVEQDLYHLNYNNYGSFAQIQYDVSRTLELTVGSRYDYNTRYGSSVNPRLGLVFKPGKLRAKLLYGEAFLAPSPEKAFQQSGAFYGYIDGKLSADYFRLPNPNLLPEKLKSTELGFSYRLKHNLSLKANAYYTIITDLINEFSEADSLLAPSNLIVTRLETSNNKGDARLYGFSFGGDYLITLGSNTINLSASYSNNQGDIDGEVVSYMAPHQLKARTDFIGKKLKASIGLRYRSASFSKLKDKIENNYTNSAFYVIDVSGGYVIMDQRWGTIEWQLSISNLLNARYYNVFVGNEEGMIQTPQDPILIMSGIKVVIK